MNSLDRARITDKYEAAKYLAATVWESLGLTATRELYCLNPANQQACKNAYGSGPGGVIYFGRGPMQLSHDYNYRAASQNIFGDPNVLLNDPDRVARESKTGWNTAAHFWSENVHDKSKTFGQTLRRINGALECEGGSHGHHMWTRCDHYRGILGHLGLKLPHRQNDCHCSSSSPW
jgi:predicted chitinase